MITQSKNQNLHKLIWVSIFSIAFAVVESAVVIYLRQIYYPNGFHFPLSIIPLKMLGVELFREFATLVMLVSIGVLAGKNLWERFAYFMFSFGMWDIFFYAWLKVLIHWPASLFEWDILFLIPLPWIGPVIAPVIISVILILSAITILSIYDKNRTFTPPLSSWIFTLAGTAMILYSFMKDTAATLHQQMPQPYGYGYLAVGIGLYIAALAVSYRNSNKH